MNRDSVYYLERVDAFEIMETHILDRVMQEYWQSNLDASGSFLGASTAFGILTRSKDSFTSNQDFDYELENRFYKRRDTEKIQPHRFNFVVVRRSMQTRYFFEIVLFFLLVAVFQYYLL